jgi:hypothetical protein
MGESNKRNIKQGKTERKDKNRQRQKRERERMKNIERKTESSLKKNEKV